MKNHAIFLIKFKLCIMTCNKYIIILNEVVIHADFDHEDEFEKDTSDISYIIQVF